MDLHDLPPLRFAPILFGRRTRVPDRTHPGFILQERGPCAPKDWIFHEVSLFNMTPAYTSKQCETTKLIVHNFGLPILERFLRLVTCHALAVTVAANKVPEMTSTREVQRG